ncbi:NAD(P)/FAD-dependent oxidoreductase [Mycobacterium sp. IDR2000157661]|uniref:NAD(P)/FAD-dependent oxidoreductase n=1 Tax=Mycobacterium sp. IDR2000157661 TaxID=2867005 RepID=UPI001EE9D445|nr:NAD(P)/FAD-dependent oxidoreductase [Mycobacterium sp. IDR2000157661]ULE34128.1 FAD-dependent oxidoreductase [Mycobacterium sp. IDR2000157661]
MAGSKRDVVVIGAGLAGLRCAALLCAHGRDVAVWEAADQIGGRVRTDEIDGFRCDRGFQVLNPAYPDLKRAVDLSLLDLQSFDVGVGIRRDHDSTRWVHPLRSPAGLPAMVTGGGLGARDVLALARWAAPALRPAALKKGRDTSLREALDRSGVNGLARTVIERFLAGVVLEDRGATSNAFVLLLARLFALGAPGLPADGMRALPRALAAPIRDRITLDRAVIDIDRAGDGWTVSAQTHTVHAREVVVATDPVTAAALTGAPAPPMHGVVTDWWATQREIPGPPMLWVDGRADPPGPVLNTAVISKAAPSYAPSGYHLVAASALLGVDGRPPDESIVRTHAADILGADARDWTLLVRHVIDHALPAQLPPLQVRRAIRTPDGMWVCGDHRDTASIQGALVSGRRTAAAMLGHG